MSVQFIPTQLLSIVSHELRTPLTSIRGHISTLLDYAEQLEPHERREALRVIDQEAARLDDLISNLLDMSRLTAGLLRVDPVAIDVVPIVKDAYERAAARAPQHRLSLSCPPAFPLALADPRRLRQVLDNLLDNAVKFSLPGTAVAVEVEPDPAVILFRVRDEGLGIAAEHLPHLFDPFYRVDNDVRVGGVGLGLAICKGIVETMGGCLTVASQVGQGSLFSFSLPRCGWSPPEED